MDISSSYFHYVGAISGHNLFCAPSGFALLSQEMVYALMDTIEISATAMR